MLEADIGAENIFNGPCRNVRPNCGSSHVLTSDLRVCFVFASAYNGV